MSDWQSMDTAPKDGTVVELRNECMTDWTILGHYGEWTNEVTGKTHPDCWVSDLTKITEFEWRQPGHLICPTEWRPATEGGIR